MHTVLEAQTSCKRSQSPVLTVSVLWPAIADEPQPKASWKGFNPSSSSPRIAAKIQTTGKAMNASRLLISDLGSRLRDPLWSKAHHFPAWLGVALSLSRPGGALQPQHAGENEHQAALDHSRPQPRWMWAEPPEMQAERPIPYVTSFHHPSAAKSQTWMLGREFALFIYSCLFH